MERCLREIATIEALILSGHPDLEGLCLALIRDIAGRGALPENPEHVGYALQEISQVLFERTGTEERRFEPVPAG